jgi:uncharacterized Zn finger protein
VEILANVEEIYQGMITSLEHETARVFAGDVGELGVLWKSLRMLKTFVISHKGILE